MKYWQPRSICRNSTVRGSQRGSRNGFCRWTCPQRLQRQLYYSPLLHYDKILKGVWRQLKGWSVSFIFPLEWCPSMVSSCIAFKTVSGKSIMGEGLGWGKLLASQLCEKERSWAKIISQSHCQQATSSTKPHHPFSHSPDSTFVPSTKWLFNDASSRWWSLEPGNLLDVQIKGHQFLLVPLPTV